LDDPGEHEEVDDREDELDYFRDEQGPELVVILEEEGKLGFGE
jgi:hypothetical protein